MDQPASSRKVYQQRLEHFRGQHAARKAFDEIKEASDKLTSNMKAASEAYEMGFKGMRAWVAASSDAVRMFLT